MARKLLAIPIWLTAHVALAGSLQCGDYDASGTRRIVIKGELAPCDAPGAAISIRINGVEVYRQASDKGKPTQFVLEKAAPKSVVLQVVAMNVAPNGRVYDSALVTVPERRSNSSDWIAAFAAIGGAVGGIASVLMALGKDVVLDRVKIFFGLRDRQRAEMQHFRLFMERFPAEYDIRDFSEWCSNLRAENEKDYLPRVGKEWTRLMQASKLGHPQTKEYIRRKNAVFRRLAFWS